MYVRFFHSILASNFNYGTKNNGRKKNQTFKIQSFAVFDILKQPKGQKYFMAVFIVLWPYLLTTKLSCLQKKILDTLTAVYWHFVTLWLCRQINSNFADTNEEQWGHIAHFSVMSHQIFEATKFPFKKIHVILCSLRKRSWEKVDQST